METKAHIQEIKDLIIKEAYRQICDIELIASENFVSQDIREALGSCLTNKYTEGYPTDRETGNKGRYYGGCKYYDLIEQKACDLFAQLFQTEYHVNVQPHSGSNANYAAYAAVLKPGDKILAMDLNNGGHLSHGLPANFSGKLYEMYFYGLDSDGFIDYDNLRKIANEEHPNAIIAGASAYSRKIDYEVFSDIAKSVSAYLIVDMAHISGIIATGYHPSPFGLADIITTTTQKILRGPRGGVIFCKPELAKKVDSAVFPGSQGGPLQNNIAAKAICAAEALDPNYKKYIRNVLMNAYQMADRFKENGFKIVSNGTDNHMFLLDLTGFDVSGKRVQNELEKHHITLNKNCIPNDPRSPQETSGVRIGTPAMTTKGFTYIDFIEVADEISEIIRNMNV